MFKPKGLTPEYIEQLVAKLRQPVGGTKEPQEPEEAEPRTDYDVYRKIKSEGTGVETKPKAMPGEPGFKWERYPDRSERVPYSRRRGRR